MAKTRTIVRYRSKPKAHRRRSQMTIPVAAIMGFAPLAYDAYDGFKRGGLPGVMQHSVRDLTGYDTGDGKWKAEFLMRGMGPILLGLVVHKFVGGRLGLNRTLAAAGVPLLRI